MDLCDCNTFLGFFFWPKGIWCSEGWSWLLTVQFKFNSQGGHTFLKSVIYFLTCEVQSLLRGRFLRNGMSNDEERPPSVAARELSQLRQRHTVSGLRKAIMQRGLVSRSGYMIAVSLNSLMLILLGSMKLFSVVVPIVLGAAGLLNFISQLMVFSWLLYYLITSESGGVLDQMLGMLPMSRTAQNRCAEVLRHAVSTVLLATAKIAFFQGCLTYLLFRFYRIHFLYRYTFLAFTSAFLPVTPPWVSSIPAAALLVVERRYVEALILTVIHHVLINFGVNSIQVDVPAQSAYLKGMSIHGGMTILPSALELYALWRDGGIPFSTILLNNRMGWWLCCSNICENGHGRK